jgi:glucokinase-like ROK family protein
MEKCAIGIDLGGTNMRVGLVSQDGQLIRKIKEPTAGDIPALIIQAIEKLFSEGCAGIGLGVAGLIDRENRRVLTSPNLPDIEKNDFVHALAERFQVPVIIENDANAAAFGEMWAGAGKNLSSFVLMTLGTGIGGGVIYNRKLLCISAEIGHMSICADGEKCPCGNYGCLETYASARAILSKAVSDLENGRESILREYCGGNFYKLTAEDIFKAALDGDALARELLKNAGKDLGIGIANMVNIMSPEAIILMGGLAGAWDIYVSEAIKEASKRSFKDLFEKVQIIPSTLMDDAGIIGAAGLALRKSIK